MKTHLHYFLGLALALGFFAATLIPAQAFLGITVGIAPPPLPVYDQPACPGDGYVWTPGYWSWDPDADQYCWVPGTWVLAPEVGYLWTPCWWGWADNAYCFHPGYWGPHVGFYGDIAYGYGYNGRGYDGGYWRGSHFYYNRAANNVHGIAASRTFSRSVEANHSRVSFNGPGGTTAVATADERRAGGEHHIGATTAQNADARSALADPAQRYSVNHGNPAVTGTSRAGSFHGASARAARGATREEGAFTGESRSASGAERRNNAGGEGAFTGESRAASSTERANRPVGENALTGGSRNATERRAQTGSEEHRSAQTRSAQPERTAATERSHVSQSHAPALASHASSYHAASSFHQPASHAGSFAHAGRGGGGGGGGFAHASAAHVGGGGGGHAGGGGHPGGGGHGGGGHGGHH